MNSVSKIKSIVQRIVKTEESDDECVQIPKMSLTFHESSMQIEDSKDFSDQPIFAAPKSSSKLRGKHASLQISTARKLDIQRRTQTSLQTHEPHERLNDTSDILQPTNASPSSVTKSPSKSKKSLMTSTVKEQDPQTYLQVNHKNIRDRQLLRKFITECDYLNVQTKH